jgi:hypothetical protein
MRFAGVVMNAKLRNALCTCVNCEEWSRVQRTEQAYEDAVAAYVRARSDYAQHVEHRYQVERKAA